MLDGTIASEAADRRHEIDMLETTKRHRIRMSDGCDECLHGIAQFGKTQADILTTFRREWGQDLAQAEAHEFLKQQGDDSMTRWTISEEAARVRGY